MEQENQADHLRDLLSLARKLRRLARETSATPDRQLYTDAAEALAARAIWLAAHGPGDRPPGPCLHVDVLV